ncbi:hypothetical protein FACS1894187_05260 [Synergistales bacterium]|nr:hypothetical protein FACS1894187_05260 [Synergistales bacterium]
MPNTQTAEREELYEMITSLPDADTDKVFAYVAFLKHLQEQEDAEDRQIVLERQDESVVSFDDVKKELGLA